MDFIKRIGTVKHKFQVEFFIGELHSNALLKGSLHVVIKRGEHKQSTLSEISMDEKKVCDFKNQILTFDAVTMYYDENQKIYQQKIGEIRVILFNKKNQKKLLGIIPFNLADYANQNKQKFREKQKLQQTPDKVIITLEYQIYIKLLGEGSETSRSIKQKEKKPQKRQSSLSKIANFVQGIFSSKDDNSSLKQQPSVRFEETSEEEKSRKQKKDRKIQKMSEMSRKDNNSDNQSQKLIRTEKRKQSKNKDIGKVQKINKFDQESNKQKKNAKINLYIQKEKDNLINKTHRMYKNYHKIIIK